MGVALVLLSVASKAKTGLLRLGSTRIGPGLLFGCFRDSVFRLTDS